MKKRKKWPIIVISIVLVVVIGTVLMFSAAADSLTKKSFTAYEVKRGNIETTITASGTLLAADRVEVELPEGISVEEALVSVGDKVAVGDKLATVDKVQAKTVANGLINEINNIDMQLSTMKVTTEETVKSSVKGVVKELYVGEGASVTQAIADKGGLCLIAAGGEMTVYVEGAAGVEAGDEVTLKVQEEFEGEVIAADAAGFTVLSTDNELPAFVTAEVYADDVLLGSGVTEVRTPVYAYAMSGTVSEVEAEQFDSVSMGATLFKLVGTDGGAAYAELKDKRGKLADDLENALSMAKSGYVLAQAEGVVSAVNEGTSSATSATYTEQQSQQSGMGMMGMMGMMGQGQSSLSTQSSVDTSVSTTAAFAIDTGGITKLTVYVGELDINEVKVGMTAQVTVDAFSGETMQAKVVKVSNYGTTGGSMTQYAVELELAADDRLMSAMSASAVIISNRVENVISVPLEAINEDEQGEFVYISESGNTDGVDNKPVYIKTGLSDGQYAEVTEGLSEGDTVMYISSEATMFEKLMSMQAEMLES